MVFFLRQFTVEWNEEERNETCFEWKKNADTIRLYREEKLWTLAAFIHGMMITYGFWPTKKYLNYHCSCVWRWVILFWILYHQGLEWYKIDQTFVIYRSLTACVNCLAQQSQIVNYDCHLYQPSIHFEHAHEYFVVRTFHYLFFHTTTMRQTLNGNSFLSIYQHLCSDFFSMMNAPFVCQFITDIILSIRRTKWKFIGWVVAKKTLFGHWELIQFGQYAVENEF